MAGKLREDLRRYEAEHDTEFRCMALPVRCLKCPMTYVGCPVARQRLAEMTGR
jgi:hypothetical protein